MLQPSLNKQAPVILVWLDITSQTDPWIERGEASLMRPAEMHTCGWILEETDTYITIYSTYDQEGELVGDVNCIPKRAILGVKEVK